ncbi:MAG: DNA polymerase III subunit delta' [bacterium]
MIDFKEIIGHEKPIKILKNRIKFGKIGHSYLFTGKEGIGKKLVAIAFSKAINCTNLSKEQNPCNQCSVCLKIEKGTSADFDIISPVDSVIKIDKIRKLKNNIFFQPLENKKKVYIVDNVDQMTTEASNSLLKILEEPPEFAVLILVTAFPDAILPTILSRCSRLSFEPLSVEYQRNILLRNTSLGKSQLENILKLSYGSPGKALALADNQQKITLINQYIASMAKIKPEELVDYIFNPEKVFPDIADNFQLFVEMMILWFRDILFLKIKMNEKQLIFQDQINAAQKYAQYYTENKLVTILEYLTNIPEELERHINQNTLLENLFIRLGD